VKLADLSFAVEQYQLLTDSYYRITAMMNTPTTQVAFVLTSREIDQVSELYHDIHGRKEKMYRHLGFLETSILRSNQELVTSNTSVIVALNAVLLASIDRLTAKIAQLLLNRKSSQ